MVVMARLTSKNLFDYQLTGEMAPGLVKMMEMMTEEQKSPIASLNELAQKDDPESVAEFVAKTRFVSEPFIKGMMANEAFAFGNERTNTTFIKVPTTHDGDHDVEVEVYTPKSLESERMRGAYLNVHGGGVIALSASDVRPAVQCVAVNLNVVVFNVDYRLAPETKCPNNIKDFYEVIKYVYNNAEALGIDRTKIVIGGESGGGYITLGAMVLLAENDESHMVKLAIPIVPMVDDYSFSDPLAMTKEERQSVPFMRRTWQLIAADFDEQKSSPYLFPGKASDELLEKFPPTIIIETEFDIFITEASRLAGRLRRAGRLLELVVIPGANHTSSFVPGTKGNKMLVETFGTIDREYIHC